MNIGEPKIRDYRVAVVVGAVLGLAALWCFYDAYDARGKRAPWILRALLPN